MATFTLTQGNDNFWADDEVDPQQITVYGLGGDDTIRTWFPDDETFVDIVYGGEGNDNISIGEGGGHAYGGNGNDFIHGDFPSNSIDVFYGNDGDDILRGEGGDDELIGGNGLDKLSGQGGNDRLVVDGSFAQGSDELRGEEGDDTYVVSFGLNFLLFSEGVLDDPGHDRLEIGVSIDIAQYHSLEDARLLFGDNTNLFGNLLSNELTGNIGRNGLFGDAGDDLLWGEGGNDTVNGESGNDTMAGGGGNDLYVVDSEYDHTVDYQNDGSDTVQAFVDEKLSANIETLELVGPLAYRGTGNSLANVIGGSEYANVLEGLGGYDTLIGRSGNDLYVLSDFAVYKAGQFTVENYDLVREQETGGIDRVYVGYQPSVFTTEGNHYYKLAANVEEAVVTGTKDFNLDGNETHNALAGNAALNWLNGAAGNDTLNGGAQYDTLIGGPGNDSYFLYDVTDRRTPDGLWLTWRDTIDDSAGIDTVRVTRAMSDIFGVIASHTLEAAIENGVIEGAGAFNLGGNNLNNRMSGNDFNNSIGGGAAGRDSLSGLGGDDFLDGGTGIDTMNGGAGNDTMFRDTSGDVIDDVPNGGIDTIYSRVTTNLEQSQNVEYLALIGSADLAANGNELANVITGQLGANDIRGSTGSDTIKGFDGNDTLWGEGGNDWLQGGNGADRFMIANINTVTRDAIQDFIVADDSFRLIGADFPTIAQGVLAAANFRIGDKALDANDRIIFNPTNNALTYDRNGNAAGGEIHFADIVTLTGALSNVDFFVTM